MRYISLFLQKVAKLKAGILLWYSKKKSGTHGSKCERWRGFALLSLILSISFLLLLLVLNGRILNLQMRSCEDKLRFKKIHDSAASLLYSAIQADKNGWNSDGFNFRINDSDNTWLDVDLKRKANEEAGIKLFKSEVCNERRETVYLLFQQFLLPENLQKLFREPPLAVGGELYGKDKIAEEKWRKMNLAEIRSLENYPLRDLRDFCFLAPLKDWQSDMERWGMEKKIFWLSVNNFKVATIAEGPGIWLAPRYVWFKKKSNVKGPLLIIGWDGLCIEDDSVLNDVVILCRGKVVIGENVKFKGAIVCSGDCEIKGDFVPEYSLKPLEKFNSAVIF